MKPTVCLMTELCPLNTLYLLLGLGGVILICLWRSAGEAVVGDIVAGCSDPASSVDPPSRRDLFPGGCSSLAFNSDLLQMEHSKIKKFRPKTSHKVTYLTGLECHISLPLSFGL